MSERPWLRYVQFWGTDVDRDIDDELRYHIEMRIADFIAGGASPEQAREAALRLFGDPHSLTTTLRAHDMRKLKQERRADMFQDLRQDVQYGIRKLMQAPRFTAAVAIVLALGIGANTAVFSAIDAAFLRPLPFFEPQRLVLVANAQIRLRPDPKRPKSIPELDDLVGMRDVFSSVAGYATGGLNLLGGAQPMRATVTYVTPRFFETLGRMPVVGRPFSNGEQIAGGRNAVVLSHALWQREFAGDPDVITRHVSLNGVEHDVVGVMPADFAFPDQTDLWIGLQVPASPNVMGAFRNFFPAHFVGRLAPRVTESLADQRLELLRRQYRPKRAKDEAPVAELATPLRSELLGESKAALFVLMGSAALLLLIACANVTNLLLSRATTRQREIAVRVVLGATRLRVIRQLTIESALLALVGGVMACFVAWACVGALTAALPAGLAAIAPPRVDIRVLGFTMLVAVVTSLIFGLWPAVGASRVNLNDAMKAGGGTATRLRGRGARGVLVIVEVSLALMLVVGAGLLIESLRTLLTIDSGIRTEHLVTARMTLPAAKYATDAAKNTFVSSVLARLTAAPGVRTAAAVTSLPMDKEIGVSLLVAPEDAPEDKTRSVFAAYLAATPRYFRALGTPLRGEDLPATSDSTHRVVVVNQTLAKKLWPGQDAIGKPFNSPLGLHTVIGVVGDIRTRALDREPTAQMYFPMAEVGEDYLSIVVRGDADTKTLIAGIRDAVKSVDPGQPIYLARTMDQVAAATVAPRRTNTVLLSAFGLLALVLAAIGVYAVLAYGVAQRTREIGVRVALGASVSDVVRLIVVQGTVLAAVGIVIGITAAYALARYLSSILYQVSIHDPVVFVVAPALLFAVALLATWLPARRAARVTPMEALREA
ncbi:MAG: ABC transporter permease [bacterium]